MTRRRRCRICGELFTADRRVGKRQKACGGPVCQRELHRRACAAWREREAPAVAEEGLRRRLVDPEGGVRLDVVRDECGGKIKVVLDELLRLFATGSRDEFRVKYVEQRRDRLRLMPRDLRDETALGGPAP